MADGFFSNLQSVLEQQFEIGENKNKTLDVVVDGHVRKYGKLGEFARNIDPSAERSWTEEGFFSHDQYNIQPKQLEVLLQEPDVTLLVKKRAFSSLAENFRPDLMDEEERLFYKATKVLFQNKCKQIANFERLTKVERIAQKIGRVDDFLLPFLFSATDALFELSQANPLNLFSDNLVSSFSQFKGVIDQVRKVVSLSSDTIFTSWITNVQNSFKTTFGEGTGVIELTTLTNIATTTSKNFGLGSFDFNIIDPYELMVITNKDIELAISAATNVFNNSNFFQFGTKTLDDIINTDKQTLNRLRIRRGAQPINFIVNPDTFLGKRVRAIIDGAGIEIQFDGNIFGAEIDPAYLFNGDLVGKDGLKNNEETLFSTIISNIFNSIQINVNSVSQIKNHNSFTNAVRKKMRLHYGKKLIIQPMDTVHVYIGSKTRLDPKISGSISNSFNNFSLLQTANKLALGIKDMFNTLDGFSFEKSIFVGSNFPNWLWSMMRNQFVSNKSGTHVFAGIVEQATSSYDEGSLFTVKVNGHDNTAYFDYGIINFKPSAEVFNGPLYDPLTPFNIKFDSISGFQKDKVPQLLDENKTLFNSAFLKYKNGIYVGRKPTPNNFIHDADKSQNTLVGRIFYDPDGLVYRWKEGIGSVTLMGDTFSERPLDEQSVPALTDDPFAGQDVMNVLSLLISGEPYNYTTFYKAAREFSGFGRDPITGQDPAVSYFKNLQNDLKSRNLIYGNFIPFKNLTLDTETFKNILNNQVTAQKYDAELQTLLVQRAQVGDAIVSVTGVSIDKITDARINDLSAKLLDLDTKIVDKRSKIVDELNQAQKPINMIGDDISFDYDPFLDFKDKNRANDPKVRRELRKKINFLTQRLIWKVRANEDVNLFVVDDTYDKDYDIQAFEKSFRNPAAFRSEYITPHQKIVDYAGLLQLEVFADTQGHIQIRVPRYNRMPSSVFYRMMRLKDEMGIQLFPQFLEDMYTNQVNNLLERIEILEDEIRLHCFVIGKTTDPEAENFIATSQNNGISFQFISKETTGRILGDDFGAAIRSANPDLTIAGFSSKLENINQQSRITDILSTSSKAGIVQSSFYIRDNSDAGQTVYIPSSDSNIQVLNSLFGSAGVQSRFDQIKNRLFMRTNQRFDEKQLFKNSDKLLSSLVISSSDLLRVLNEISSRIEERQRLLKYATAAIKNAKQGNALIENEDRLANKMLFPDLYGNKEIPESFEFLIEDESYDDLGPGSGKRYVIKNYQILNYSIQENKPQYTAVEVEGRFGDNFIPSNQLPDGLNAFQSGNALVTAAAVDYDLWRMYGINVPGHVVAPYLSDPNTQCAPFAVSLLSQARQNILKGSITITGNEFMQPGEVVYLETRDLLFYVESVNHSFALNGQFTTTLNVSYGHNPGEFIPTWVDVIGKILYKNKDITNNTHIRQGNSINQEHVGIIVGNNTTSFGFGGDANTDISDGSFGAQNRINIDNIIKATVSAFNTSSAVPSLEIRVYHHSAAPNLTSTNSYALSLANAVKDYILGNNDLFGSRNTELSSKLRQFTSKIQVVEVDSFTDSEFRYPSSKAYAQARDLAKSKYVSTSQGENRALVNLIDNNIYKMIVDCWIVFAQD